jgi:arylformamidase
MTMSTASALTNPDYANQRAVPDFSSYFERWRTLSEAFRNAAPSCLLDVPYGPGWRQNADIFPVDIGKKVPVFVFIHGGWWYFLDKKDHSFIVKPFYEQGCVCVCVTYPLAPSVTITEIVESVRQSLLWVYRNIERFGGDPDRIHIAGHSAGGHLTAMMMLTDWTLYGAPRDLIKSGCAVSGLFNLVEILNVPQNANFRMLPNVAYRNSPIRLIPEAARPLIVCVGKNETAGFLRQHKEFVAAWASETRPLIDASLDGENHFSVIEHLGRSESSLFKTVIPYVAGNV